MKKRTIIIIIISALVLAGTLFGFVTIRQRTQTDGVDYQTYQIGFGDLSAVVDETGIVHADQSSSLFWASSGIVDQVMAALGDEVKADQLLASLSEDSLPQSYFMSQQELITATRALEDLYNNAAKVAANAQSALATARDQLDKAEYRWRLNQPGNRYTPEELKKAKAQLTIAKKQLDSKQSRFNNANGSIPEAQAQILLTAAINQYQQAAWYVKWLQEGADEIEMAILDANVSVALATLETAEREYEKVMNGPAADDIKISEIRITAAQAALDTAEIRAPFDGVITGIDVLSGDLVAPNSLAFRIDNLNNLLVDVGVSEVDITQITAGQPVILSFDAILDKEFQGEVVKVSPVGVQQQGLVSFEVTIKVLDADDDVRPGLTAAVQIVVHQVEDILLIPNRAVRWVKGEQVVYISTVGGTTSPESMERIPVIVGASSDEFTELLEGDLEEGDFVVLNPPSINIFEEMGPGMGPGMGSGGGFR